MERPILCLPSLFLLPLPLSSHLRPPLPPFPPQHSSLAPFLTPAQMTSRCASSACLFCWRWGGGVFHCPLKLMPVADPLPRPRPMLVSDGDTAAGGQALEARRLGSCLDSASSPPLRMELWQNSFFQKSLLGSLPLSPCHRLRDSAHALSSWFPCSLSLLAHVFPCATVQLFFLKSLQVFSVDPLVPEGLAVIPPLPESPSLAISPSPKGALPECWRHGPSQGRSSCEGRSRIFPSSTPLGAGPVLDTGH